MLEQLSDYWLLRKDSAPWSYLNIFPENLNVRGHLRDIEVQEGKNKIDLT
jgi:hypothetical protein